MTKHAHENAQDEYTLRFHKMTAHNVLVRNEELVFKRMSGRGRRITISGGSIAVADLKKVSSSTATLSVQESSSGLAILRRLGKAYEAPQIEDIAQIFEPLRLFDVSVSAARRPALISGSEHLNTDGANIAAFLVYLKDKYPPIFDLVKEDVAFVFPGFRDFVFHYFGGADNAVRVDINETPLQGSTPLARASFGTIRAIALFAMLHDPNPPKLTCIEEVDHGLHPHALDRLVERLREASKRTQIVVATHSPALVNRLRPEELIIFQRDPETGATIRPKISPAEMHQMEKNSGLGLGELWFSGAIGGIV